MPRTRLTDVPVEGSLALTVRRLRNKHQNPGNPYCVFTHAPNQQRQTKLIADFIILICGYPTPMCKKCWAEFQKLWFDALTEAPLAPDSPAPPPATPPESTTSESGCSEDSDSLPAGQIGESQPNSTREPPSHDSPPESTPTPSAPTQSHEAPPLQGPAPSPRSTTS